MIRREMHFADPVGLVTAIAEVFNETGILAKHRSIIRASGDMWRTSGGDRRPRGHTDGGGGVAAGECCSVLNQPVEDGRANVGITMSPDRIEAVLVGEEEENVRAVWCHES